MESWLADDETFPESGPPIWQALGYRPTGALDPQQVVDAVLQFANGKISPNEDRYITPRSEEELTAFAAEKGRRFHPVYDRKVFLRRPGSPLAVDGSVFREISYQEALSEAREEINGYRSLARSMLEAAALGVNGLVQVIATYSRERRVSNVSQRPTIRLRASGKQNLPQLGWMLEGPPTADGWIVFAALTIADGATNRGQTQIGHCGWGECGMFFRVEKTKGTPRRKYCSSTHQELAHNADSTRRSQRRRKRLDAEKAARKANGPARRRQSRTEK